MALALGARVDLVTRLNRDYDRTVLEGLEVTALEAELPCRYANTYDAEGRRTQLLLHPGEPLGAPFAEMRGDIAFAAPAYHELDGFPPIEAPLRAISLQGALRAAEGERVIFHPQPFAQVEAFLAPGTLAFLSDEDAADPRAIARHGASLGATVTLTCGQRGAIVFDGPREIPMDAIPANAADPTGAGDCFAMAFAVRMAETGDLLESCRFAMAAGSLTVEGKGIAAIPSRAAIEHRLQREAA